MALYGTETLTLRKVIQKCLGNFEVLCWRTYHVKTEEVLHAVKEGRKEYPV
jgi:hypothetical protein